MLRVSAPLLQSELSFVVLVAELSPSLQGVGWEMQRASRCGRHLSESPWQVLEAGRALAVPARHLAVGTLLPLCSLGLGATGTPVPTVTVPRCCTLPSAKRAAKQKFTKAAPQCGVTPKEKQKRAGGPGVPWRIATARLRAPACGAAPSCAGWGLEPFYFSSWA